MNEKKCIQTKNIYGHDLVSGCRSLDDYDFHVFDKWECASSEWVRQACEHHEPLYAEVDPILGIPTFDDAAQRLDAAFEHARATINKTCDRLGIAPTPAFWLVWRDGYNSTPHYKHATEADAKAEAERLARNNPGHAFYVLPATSYAQCAIQPVTWSHGNAEGLEAEDVPF